VEYEEHFNGCTTETSFVLVERDRVPLHRVSLERSIEMGMFNFVVKRGRIRSAWSGAGLNSPCELFSEEDSWLKSMHVPVSSSSSPLSSSSSSSGRDYEAFGVE